MQITRRQFLRYVAASAAAMGLTQHELTKLIEVMSKDSTPFRVVWLAGQACTGCTMAFTDLISYGYTDAVNVPDHFDVGTLDETLRGAPLNWTYPDVDTVDDVLLTVIDLDFHETIQATAGEQAMDWLRPWLPGAEAGGNCLDTAVLVVEGAIPVRGQDPWGRPTVGSVDPPASGGIDPVAPTACTIGTVPPQFATDPRRTTEITMHEAVANLAKKAIAVVAVGNCASFGGIPAAYSDPRYAWTGAKGVQGACPDLEFWKYPREPGEDNRKLVNVPGCPPHPDWMYGTIARIILDYKDVLNLTVDTEGRPNPYYTDILHAPGRCPRYQDYHDGFLAVKLGDKGCLSSIGCYGMSTHTDCARRGWNNTRNNLNRNVFCVEAGHPCIGCTEKGYPFRINGG